MKNLLKQTAAALIGLSLVLGMTPVLETFASTIALKVVQTPAIHLYSGISGSATSMRITPYPKDLDGTKLTMSDFGTNPTVTVDPKVTNYEEIIGFTGLTDNGDNTATLTGLTRDLLSKYPYTTAGTGRSHGAGATVVFGNNPQIYGRLATLENDQTFSGINTFSSTTQPRYDGSPTFTNSLALIDKAYADALSIGGAPTSTESSMGVVWLASNTQAGSGTASSTTGAPLVLGARLATSTCQVAQSSVLVASSTTGRLSPTCFDQTYSYTLTGTTTLASSTIYTANIGTLSATSTLRVGGASLVPQYGGTGADGALSISSGTTTINCAGASICIKNYSSISITGTAALVFSSPAASGTVVIIRDQGDATITSTAHPAIDVSGMGASAGVQGISTFLDTNFGTGGGSGGGGPSQGAGGAGGAALVYDFFTNNLTLKAVAGAGGANGVAGSTSGTPGTGGIGGGALELFVGGNLSASGIFRSNGTAGTNGASGGTSNAGNGNPGGGGGGGGTNTAGSSGTVGSGTGGQAGSGGGGGGAGSINVLYTGLTSNTAIFELVGGAGGTGSNGSTGKAGDGGAGGTGFSNVQQNYLFN